MRGSVYAQAGTQGTPHPVGVPAEVGDGWTISVETATLTISAAADGRAVGPPKLMTTVRVQNTALEPRTFPTYRLQLVSGSGPPQRDTWCGRDPNPLELSGPIAPNGSQTGTVCWALSSADVSNVALSVDPAPSEAGRQPGLFSLAPIASIIAPAGPTAAPAVSLPTSSAAGVGGSPAPSTTDSPPSRCSRTYSMYADGAGTYLMADCPASGSGTSSAPLMAPVGSTCQLYPSARQPSTSSSDLSRLYPSARQLSSGSVVNNSTGLTPALAPTPTNVGPGASNGASC